MMKMRRLHLGEFILGLDKLLAIYFAAGIMED